MEEQVKSKKKIDLRLLMLVVCALCTIIVGLILGLKVNQLNVKAYHLDSDGNYVSDNIESYQFDINLSAGNEVWTSVTLTSELTGINWVNNTTYYIRSFFDKQSTNATCQIPNYGYRGCADYATSITFNGTYPELRWGANTLSGNIVNSNSKIMVSTTNFDAYEPYGETFYSRNNMISYNGLLSLEAASIAYGNDLASVSDVSDGITISLSNMYQADNYNINQTMYIFKLNKYISLNSNIIFNFNGVIDSQLNNHTYVNFYKDNLSNLIYRTNYSSLINYGGELKRLIEEKYLTYPIFNYIVLTIDEDGNGLSLIKSNTSLTSISVVDSSYNYNLGYNNGYDVGYLAGYNSENSISYNSGYEDGYNYALEHASENSLVGLVGAVATTPVTLLSTIFNFEFLGINIAGFVLSIITLLVVIWLIKRFI